MKLGWGIIRLGQLANQWIASAIEASRNGQLVACADAIGERADHFASIHGIGRVYHSYQPLVEDPRVEAVYVATPNALHHPVVLAAARARRHVLCQKPMAFTTREAEEMLIACDRAGITLRIGLHLRFQRVLQAAADYVGKGALGTVREVSAQRYAPVSEAKQSGWRYDLALAGAGALADVGVHVIDFVQWIVGRRVKRVFAVAYPDRASGRPDEPSEGLAPLLVRQVAETIRRLRGKGMSILLVEENLHVALELADKVYIMTKGRVVYEDLPDELSRDERIKEQELGIRADEGAEFETGPDGS